MGHKARFNPRRKRTRYRELGTAPPHRHAFALRGITTPDYARCTVDWCGVLALADSDAVKRLRERYG